MRLLPIYALLMGLLPLPAHSFEVDGFRAGISLAEARAIAARTASVFRMAAEGDDPVAAFNLAVCHLRAVGLAKDVGLALHWFGRPADRIVYAQYRVGRLLYDEASEAADLPVARTWFRRASENGHLHATVALSEMLGNGRRSAAEPCVALRLQGHAAEAAHVAAMFGAGALLEGGHGLPADHVQT